MKLTFADVTATTRQSGQLGAGQSIGNPSAAWWFFVQIYQKAFTAGSGSTQTVYLVEVADDSGFTQNVTGQWIVLGRAAGQTGFGIVFAPGAAKRFVGITRVANGTDAATYDAMIFAA
jgi:hypothetical protein